MPLCGNSEDLAFPARCHPRRLGARGPELRGWLGGPSRSQSHVPLTLTVSRLSSYPHRETFHARAWSRFHLCSRARTRPTNCHSHPALRLPSDAWRHLGILPGLVRLPAMRRDEQESPEAKGRPGHNPFCTSPFSLSHSHWLPGASSPVTLPAPSPPTGAQRRAHRLSHPESGWTGVGRSESRQLC